MSKETSTMSKETNTISKEPLGHVEGLDTSVHWKAVKENEKTSKETLNISCVACIAKRHLDNVRSRWDIEGYNTTTRHKRPLTCQKRPITCQKRPTQCQKPLRYWGIWHLCLLQNCRDKTHNTSKETYNMSKETYNMSRETYTMLQATWILRDLIPLFTATL